MAFNFKNIFRRPSVQEAQTETAFATVTEQGGVVGQRPLQNPAIAAGYTPERVASILTNAETGEPNAIREAFQLFDRTYERDHHIQGVVNGLVTAIVGLEHRVKPKDGDNRRIARAIAEDVQKLFAIGGPVRMAEFGILTQGIMNSIGPGELIWETSPTRWDLRALVLKQTHWFSYDRKDGRTPMLLPEQQGQSLLELQRGKFVAFCPQRASALQIKNALGWSLCWIYVIKALLSGDKLDFVKTFGKPIVYGKYGREADPESIGLLKQAIAALNSNFRAVLREDLNVEFANIAQTGTDMHEKAQRLMDEYASKVIWANTLASDNGGGAGSYALGKVHAEGKYDVSRAYAHQLAATFQRDVVEPFVFINYGPNAPMPTLEIDVEEAEDLVAGSTIVANLVGAGVAIAADEVRERFGFRKPEPGEEVIGGPSAAPATPADPAADAEPGAAQNSRGCPVHSHQAYQRDAIDDLADQMLVDYERVTPSIDAMLAEAVLNAGSVQAAVEALLDIARNGKVEDLQALFTANTTATRAAGKLGGEV